MNNTKSTATLYFRPEPGQPDAYIVTEILRFHLYPFFPDTCLVRLSNGNVKIAFFDELEVVTL